jgi:putative transposase
VAKAAVVARVMRVSRQAIYRTPRRRTDPGPRPVSGEVDEAIVEVAKQNPTDGTRMVAALTSREIGRPISRKRAQRVMRQERLLQRHRPLFRRKRPGFSRVIRPDQLWHMDMTSVWTAEHGLVLSERDHRLLQPRDPGLGTRHPLPKAGGPGGGRGRARRPPGRGRSAGPRDRQRHRLYVAVLSRPVAELGVTHRRGGYRDPESQAFIESWFS